MAEELRAELEKLHIMLSDTRGLDDETVTSLRTVAQDIENLLSTEETDQPEGLRERIESTISEFEAEHPRLTAILSQLIDGLAQFGI